MRCSDDFPYRKEEKKEGRERRKEIRKKGRKERRENIENPELYRYRPHSHPASPLKSSFPV